MVNDGSEDEVCIATWLSVLKRAILDAIDELGCWSLVSDCGDCRATLTVDTDADVDVVSSSAVSNVVSSRASNAVLSSCCE